MQETQRFLLNPLQLSWMEGGADKRKRREQWCFHRKKVVGNRGDLENSEKGVQGQREQRPRVGQAAVATAGYVAVSRGLPSRGPVRVQ